eukprot:298861-Amphidinium_carterae.1
MLALTHNRKAQDNNPLWKTTLLSAQITVLQHDPHNICICAAAKAAPSNKREDGQKCGQLT